MTYWRCIKCRWVHHGTTGQTAHRCACGEWCVNVTDVIKNFSTKDMTAAKVKILQREIENRCIGV